MKNYLSADGPSKAAIYELVAGAAAGCQPDISDAELEGVRLAQASAKIALKVVRVRERQSIDDKDQLAASITDAYATVAIAYRRASAAYTVDGEMQKLGDCGCAPAYHSNLVYGGKGQCARVMTDPSLVQRRYCEDAVDKLLQIEGAELIIPTHSVAEMMLRGTVMYLSLFIILRFVMVRQTSTIGIADILVMS
ncbi:hypothetical protein JQ634_30795 [Bradyrhizobium sp. AUGA SZCCT0240]|uniref:hypothetical protein n=1 Tax=unclassified Bradyrhizobium TaxID=2631580 RepID=UPI001BA73278|nr:MULTISPECIES: hypothetical protein [unclassified Bradyrhizobium]MBR1193811.1 hypothetical protein [Bradyrhizobium sp. AUGA SZCCT0160]MBR1200005.1 hypothetical protein [Bradyrhizobium sp. AUGA SZCCT0158]MBR1244321.1 hypothetical protein [Bradyrhizobium sp. AUGA SZCCT0274]MBR1258054.1 hypothetical protein [Bradyrhizobium sp. AUGA SZCCT0240]